MLLLRDIAIPDIDDNPPTNAYSTELNDEGSNNIQLESSFGIDDKNDLIKSNITSTGTLIDYTKTRPLISERPPQQSKFDTYTIPKQLNEIQQKQKQLNSNRNISIRRQQKILEFKTKMSSWSSLLLPILWKNDKNDDDNEEIKYQDMNANDDDDDNTSIVSDLSISLCNHNNFGQLNNNKNKQTTNSSSISRTLQYAAVRKITSTDLLSRRDALRHTKYQNTQSSNRYFNRANHRSSRITAHDLLCRRDTLRHTKYFNQSSSSQSIDNNSGNTTTTSNTMNKKKQPRRSFQVTTNDLLSRKELLRKINKTYNNASRSSSMRSIASINTTTSSRALSLYTSSLSLYSSSSSMYGDDENSSYNNDDRSFISNHNDDNNNDHRYHPHFCYLGGNDDNNQSNYDDDDDNDHDLSLNLWDISIYNTNDIASTTSSSIKILSPVKRNEKNGNNMRWSHVSLSTSSGNNLYKMDHEEHIMRQMYQNIQDAKDESASSSTLSSSSSSTTSSSSSSSSCDSIIIEKPTPSIIQQFKISSTKKKPEQSQHNHQQYITTANANKKDGEIVDTSTPEVVLSTSPIKKQSENNPALQRLLTELKMTSCRRLFHESISSIEKITTVNGSSMTKITTTTTTTAIFDQHHFDDDHIHLSSCMHPTNNDNDDKNNIRITQNSDSKIQNVYSEYKQQQLQISRKDKIIMMMMSPSSSIKRNAYQHFHKDYFDSIMYFE